MTYGKKGEENLLQYESIRFWNYYLVLWFPPTLVKDEIKFAQHSDAPLLHDAYVTKPIRLSLLLDHIGRLLNLNWCYEEDNNQLLPVLPDMSPPVSLTPAIIATVQLPAEIYLKRLRELALIGHKNGLQKLVQQLADSGQANQLFTEQVNQLIGNFQFEKIVALLNDQSNNFHHSNPGSNYDQF